MIDNGLFIEVCKLATYEISHTHLRKGSCENLATDLFNRSPLKSCQESWHFDKEISASIWQCWSFYFWLKKLEYHDIVGMAFLVIFPQSQVFLDLNFLVGPKLMKFKAQLFFLLENKIRIVTNESAPGISVTHSPNTWSRLHMIELPDFNTKITCKFDYLNKKPEQSSWMKPWDSLPALNSKVHLLWSRWSLSMFRVSHWPFSYLLG